MNKKQTVKKVYSLNPKRFKSVNLVKASNQYADYINYFIKDNDYSFKTFVQWLETEI